MTLASHITKADPPAHHVEYGRQVEIARRVRGLDQKAAAAQIGVHPSTLSRIEHGRFQRLSHIAAEGIERVLGVVAPATASVPSELEAAFETYWKQCAPADAPPYETEVLFDSTRQWRFDVAWRHPLRVAVELHGGEYSGGRHVTGTGFIGDRHKINAATLQNWIVLEFTSTMLHTDPCGCIEQIVQALRRRGARV